MTPLPLRTALLVSLLATPAAAQGFDDYPFLGIWTCGPATYTFTADTFNDGAKDVFITEITSGTNNFRVSLATNIAIDITAVTDTSMNLTSDATGESFICTRLQ